MPKSPSLSVLFFDTKMFCNLMSRCKMLLTQRRTAVGWPHHTVASDSLSTVGKAECAVTNTARPIHGTTLLQQWHSVALSMSPS